MKNIPFKIDYHIRSDLAKIINIKGIPTERELVQQYRMEDINEYGRQDPNCFFFPTRNTNDRPFFTIEREENGFTDIHRFYLWQEITLDQMKEIDRLVSKAYENYCRVFGINKEGQER
jgi:hypothetical protein